MAKSKFIIWGSSGHAKVLTNLIRQQGGEVAAFFDNDSKSKPAYKGIPLYIGKQGFMKWLKGIKNPADFSGLVAIGGPRGNDRIEIQELFSKNKIKLKPVIHKTAYVCETAKIGKGTQVLAHVLVSSDAVIGDACILNHKASVDHECVLGDGVHLAPGAILCGCVELGDNVMIAAGATVLPRIKVGKNTIVGAGSVVTRDLPANVVAYGNPARIIRPNKKKS